MELTGTAIDLADWLLEPVADQPVSYNHLVGSARPGGALRVRAGEERFDPSYNGRTFLGIAGTDFSSTQLYELTPSGLEPSISVTGSLQTLTPLDRSR